MKHNLKTSATLNPIELAEMIRLINGHPFGYFQTWTTEDLKGGKKTLAQFGGIVYKFTRANAMTNIDYTTAVANKLAKYGIDDTYQHEEHKWLDRHKTENGKLTPLGYHRADSHLPLMERRLYIVLSFLNVFEVSYFDADFNPIPNEVIAPLRYDNTSKKQIEAGIPQDDQIIYRQYKLESIREITINGTIFTIVAE